MGMVVGFLVERLKVDCFSQGARRVAQKQEDDLLSYYETC